MASSVIWKITTFLDISTQIGEPYKTTSTTALLLLYTLLEYLQQYISSGLWPKLDKEDGTSNVVYFYSEWAEMIMGAFFCSIKITALCLAANRLLISFPSIGRYCSCTDRRLSRISLGDVEADDGSNPSTTTPPCMSGSSKHDVAHHLTDHTHTSHGWTLCCLCWAMISSASPIAGPLVHAMDGRINRTLLVTSLSHFYKQRYSKWSPLPQHNLALGLVRQNVEWNILLSTSMPQFQLAGAKSDIIIILLIQFNFLQNGIFSDFKHKWYFWLLFWLHIKCNSYFR